MGKMLDMLERFIHDPAIRFGYLSKLGLFNYITDSRYLKKKYKVYMKKELNLDTPRTFNEKLQWLKLYDRRPEYTMMVDKYQVRKYIAEKLGEKYLIPLIGVWDDPDEIDFGALPNQFVLKCNHNSGVGMCICKDKSKLDIKKVKRELRRGLKENYYLANREWPYKNVQRRIICEQYIEDESGNQLKDYKIFCFHGKPKFIQVDYDRFSGHKRNLYDAEWNYLDKKYGYPTDPSVQIVCPNRINEMLEIAERLSKDMIFVRIDLYSIDKTVYFGEITFYPAAGLIGFEPEEWDEIVGNWIKLPNKGSA